MTPAGHLYLRGVALAAAGTSVIVLGYFAAWSGPGVVGRLALAVLVFVAFGLLILGGVLFRRAGRVPAGEGE